MASTLPWHGATTLRVAAWPDPVVDQVGHDPRSVYVETFWLPALGPSACWLLRRLVATLEAEPAGFDLDLAATASALGLGGGTSRHSPVVRTLARIVHFRLARPTDPEAVEVRRRLPPLTRRQASRLPAALRDDHARWLADQLAPEGVDRQRRARALALSLLELGEDRSATEQQLTRWRFTPAAAARAVTWAAEVHEYRTRHPAGQGARNEVASSTSVRTP